MEEFIWEKINESKFIMLKELNKDFKETAIGLIPEDWEVKKLREVSKNRNSSLSINNLLDNNGQYVLYGAGGFLKRIDFYNKHFLCFLPLPQGQGSLRPVLSGRGSISPSV